MVILGRSRGGQVEQNRLRCTMASVSFERAGGMGGAGLGGRGARGSSR